VNTKFNVYLIIHLLVSITASLCLGGAVVERWTRDKKVTDSTPSWGAIKSTRSTQPSIPPGYGKSSTSLHGWG